MDAMNRLLQRETEESATVVLLAPTEESANRIGCILRDRYESEDLCVLLLPTPAEHAIREARSQFGGAPLGFVALDEVVALEAVSNGADEVLVWPARDDTAIHGFFDRTKLRARLRKEQEQSSAAVAHAEKLAALGTLVAGVAHEINNPLTVLQLSVEACTSLMKPLTNVAHELKVLSVRGGGATAEQVRTLFELSQTGAPQREGKELLDEMLAAATSIAEVVRDLRIFARSDGDREAPELVDVNDVIDQALRLVGREVEAAGHIERDYSSELPRLVVPQGRLTQVLINILVNASHAIREVERPVHRVRISTRADEEFVAISISDTGPGIAPDAVERIFDPFFTTKRAGYGTGLGLSISKSIMRGLGGDLIVESVHGTGATFIAFVPIPDHATIREAYLHARGPSQHPRAVERRNVLVVDNDERILKAYARVLGRSCNVMIASDGQEAIDLLRSGSKADALVTELSLPDVDGQSLFEWLQQKEPALAERTVFVAAEATRERYKTFLGCVNNRVLTKPITASTLLMALNETVRAEATSEVQLTLL